jgi:CTP-dependent riboflavin kinase
MIFKNPYQDIEEEGKVIVKGNRECNSRWEALLPFLARYNEDEPLKILDFGANYGYFSWKLAELFPNANITMVDYEPILKELYEKKKNPNINLIHQFMELKDIKKLVKKNDYDLILCLSVLHHFKEFKELIEVFIRDSKTVLFEVGYPTENPITNHELVKPIYDYLITKNPIQINSWVEHDRPIYYVNKDEMVFKGIVRSGARMASTETFKQIDYLLYEKLNEDCYHGTLNIKFPFKIGLKNEESVATYYSLVPIFINGFPVYNIRPQNRINPTPYMELISPFKLRWLFGLVDGQSVNISLNNTYFKEIDYDMNDLGL